VRYEWNRAKDWPGIYTHAERHSNRTCLTAYIPRLVIYCCQWNYKPMSDGVDVRRGTWLESSPFGTVEDEEQHSETGVLTEHR